MVREREREFRMQSETALKAGKSAMTMIKSFAPKKLRKRKKNETPLNSTNKTQRAVEEPNLKASKDNGVYILRCTIKAAFLAFVASIRARSKQ